MTTIRSLAPVPHLLGSDPYGTEPLDCYRAAGGYTRIDPEILLARVDASGLRGRGGAAFPLATKLRSVVASATETGSHRWSSPTARRASPVRSRTGS